MEIKLTPSAVDELKAKIAEQGGNSGVRVYVAGMGWGGPTFGLTLDEPKETDNVYEVEGVKVLFDKGSSRYTKGFEIDYRSSIFGKRFSVSQLYGGGSCH